MPDFPSLTQEDEKGRTEIRPLSLPTISVPSPNINSIGLADNQQLFDAFRRLGELRAANATRRAALTEELDRIATTANATNSALPALLNRLAGANESQGDPRNTVFRELITRLTAGPSKAAQVAANRIQGELSALDAAEKSAREEIKFLQEFQGKQITQATNLAKLRNDLVNERLADSSADDLRAFMDSGEPAVVFPDGVVIPRGRIETRLAEIEKNELSVEALRLSNALDKTTLEEKQLAQARATQLRFLQNQSSADLAQIAANGNRLVLEDDEVIEFDPADVAAAQDFVAENEARQTLIAQRRVEQGALAGTIQETANRVENTIFRFSNEGVDIPQELRVQNQVIRALTANPDIQARVEAGDERAIRLLAEAGNKADAARNAAVETMLKRLDVKKDSPVGRAATAFFSGGRVPSDAAVPAVRDFLLNGGIPANEVRIPLTGTSPIVDAARTTIQGAFEGFTEQVATGIREFFKKTDGTDGSELKDMTAEELILLLGQPTASVGTEERRQQITAALTPIVEKAAQEVAGSILVESLIPAALRTARTTAASGFSQISEAGIERVLDLTDKRFADLGGTTTTQFLQILSETLAAVALEETGDINFNAGLELKRFVNSPRGQVLFKQTFGALEDSSVFGASIASIINNSVQNAFENAGNDMQRFETAIEADALQRRIDARRAFGKDPTVRDRAILTLAGKRAKLTETETQAVIDLARRVRRPSEKLSGTQSLINVLGGSARNRLDAQTVLVSRLPVEDILMRTIAEAPPDVQQSIKKLLPHIQDATDTADTLQILLFRATGEKEK